MALSEKFSSNHRVSSALLKETVMALAKMKAEAPSCVRPGLGRRAVDVEPGALALASVWPASLGRAYRSCLEASDLPRPG